MAATHRSDTDDRSLLRLAPLAVWAIVCIAIGALYADEPVGLVGVGLGCVILAVTIAGAWWGAWRGAMVATVALTGGGLLGAGVLVGQMLLALAGVLTIMLAGLAVPVLHALRGLADAQRRAAEQTATLERRLADLNEHAMLSDNARRVLFRERELGLLRRAIEEDLRRGDFNAALRLVQEMAEGFGYREEAEAFRGQILAARDRQQQAAMTDALHRFEQMLSAGDWQHAAAEAARLARLYPDSQLARDVQQRLSQAREARKRELESAFLDAAERNEMERAMSLLRELDRQLTPDEAAKIADVAQRVIQAHRNRLSEAFKAAVNERRWADAARIGQTITSEYPNTTMAREVAGMIDMLRTRASQAAAAASH